MGNMVLPLMMLMVPPQKDLLTMMTMLPEMFLLMLMLLPRLPLPMRMLDVAVPAEALAAQLSGRHQGLDVTRGLPPGGNKSRDADVDLSPSQSHTEDQGGTPLPSDIRDKRLNSKAD